MGGWGLPCGYIPDHSGLEPIRRERRWHESRVPCPVDSGALWLAGAIAFSRARAAEMVPSVL